MPIRIKNAFVALALNHVDAWGIATIASLLALVVHQALTMDGLWLVLVFGLGYWLAFAVNDYFDAPYDQLDPAKAKGNFFIGLIDRPRVRRILWAMFFVLVGVIAMIFLRFGWAGVIVLAVSLSVMLAYSAPPVRLKNRPGLDLLVHALFVETFPYVATVYLIGGTWGSVDFFLVFIAFMASLSAQLEQQLRDFEVDQATGGTSATLLGRRATYVLLVLATLLLIFGAVAYHMWRPLPWYLIPFAFIALPVLLHRLVRGPNRPRSRWLVYVSAAAGLIYAVSIAVYLAISARS